jgi:hypothetical protein
MVRALRSWIRNERLPLDVVGGGGELRIPQEAPCVCDLISAPVPAPPKGIGKPRPFPVVLAIGVGGIPTPWVGVVKHRHPVVVTVPPEDVGPFRSIVAALDRELHVDPEELRGRIILNHPHLAAVSDDVRAVCADPWAVRRAGKLL